MSDAQHDRNVWAENRLGIDYRAAAADFAKPDAAIIDVHTHVNGGKAAAVWREAANLYGVTRTYTQTRWADAHAVRETLGDAARFIAIPNYGEGDRGHALGEGMLEMLPKWAEEFGARMMKFWVAPRLREFLKDSGHEDLAILDSPMRRRQADLATELNMMLMAHVADPDTWFRGMYSDSKFFGSKKDQYSPLQAMLERYTQPWMLAHMAGWPEDLDFLDTLLERYPHVHLDTSATKWMVRELSKHESTRVHEFFERWQGRVFFGTDIVTSDDHLAAVDSGEITGKAQQANSPEQAFDLYASRYWAMRTLLEGDYDGQSPIADGDLAMNDPEAFDDMSAPRLRGHGLSGGVLRSLHRDAAVRVLDAWYDKHA